MSFAKFLRHPFYRTPPMTASGLKNMKDVSNFEDFNLTVVDNKTKKAKMCKDLFREKSTKCKLFNLRKVKCLFRL